MMPNLNKSGRWAAPVGHMLIAQSWANAAMTQAFDNAWYPRPDSNRHALRRGILNPLDLLPFKGLRSGVAQGCARERIVKVGRSLIGGAA